MDAPEGSVTPPLRVAFGPSTESLDFMPPKTPPIIPATAASRLLVGYEAGANSTLTAWPCHGWLMTLQCAPPSLLKKSACWVSMATTSPALATVERARSPLGKVCWPAATRTGAALSSALDAPDTVMGF